MSRFDDLRTLGLSKVEIAVYKALSAEGSMTVGNIAKQINVAPQSLYRVLNKLESSGFIVNNSDNYPLMYQARPFKAALREYLKYQRKLVDQITPIGHDNQQMTVLTGKNELFNTYVKLAKKANHELLTISIGEKVPNDLYDVIKEANVRGVVTKFIFQNHSINNDRWLKRWVVEGSEVKILPGEGYHLNVFDSNKAIISSSNTSNTEERTCVLIDSPNVTAELREYFYLQWKKAEQLKRLINK